MKKQVLFIRLKDEDSWLKQQLEHLAWENKQTVSAYVSEILVRVAKEGTDHLCKKCPVKHKPNQG